MEKAEIERLIRLQREFFESGETLALSFRDAALKKLYKAVKEYECALCAALFNNIVI